MSLSSSVPGRCRSARAFALAVACTAGASCADRPEWPPMGPGITLTPANASILVGDSVVFSVTARRSDAFRWTSSAPTVAAVSATGVVSGLAPGRSTISAAVVPDRALAASAVVDVRAP